mmetsp:Transcript_115596/g.326798  ORF Transcript_115596/g.326798 Transcript_115596/m.326798 type:complete len:402 (-) Transcript_115596:100-1305(-)
MLRAQRGLPVLKLAVERNTSERQTPLVEKKYKLYEIIGNGSTAFVRRAMSRDSNEPCAVKTMHNGDPEGLLVAEKEFQLLSRIQHPNIVRVLEIIADHAANRVDLVTALVSGLRLDVLVHREGPLPEHGAKPLFIQLMSALQHCHVHRICHRDIKPANIMVAEDGAGQRSLVLMDFNAACEQYCLTPTGTRPYMSPEAWKSHANYNEMTDVWSSGVCLYFMLARYLPWVGRRYHVLSIEVTSFPLRFPAGLSQEALHLLGGLICRRVESRFMVAEALAHPWCGLIEEGVPSSPRDSWSGRRLSLQVEHRCLQEVTLSVRKRTWSTQFSTSDASAIPVRIGAQHQVAAQKAEERWYSQIDVSTRSRVQSVPGRDWEVERRRGHVKPKCRNRETKIRRASLRI